MATFCGPQAITSRNLILSSFVEPISSSHIPQQPHQFSALETLRDCTHQQQNWEVFLTGALQQDAGFVGDQEELKAIAV